MCGTSRIPIRWLAVALTAIAVSFFGRATSHASGQELLAPPPFLAPRMPGGWGPIPFDGLAHGEYLGPPRMPHVPEYRMRVDDQIEFVYVVAREDLSRPYQLQVGDVLRVESIIDPNLNREVTVQPDGTIDLLLLGATRAARRTANEVRTELNERYKEFYRVTDLHVTRVRTQSRLDELRAAIDGKLPGGGQGLRVRVAPDGTVSLPAIGAAPAQGLTLAEIKREVEERYRQTVAGLEVTPILAQRAPCYVYVAGEARTPGRYELVAPTTVVQAVALAGGWTKHASLRNVAVFRRDDDWRLIATRLDLRGAAHGHQAACLDDLWIRDGDLILIPKSARFPCDHFFGLPLPHSECRK